MVDPRLPRIVTGLGVAISAIVSGHGLIESVTCRDLGCTLDAADRIESLRRGDQGPGAVPEIVEISTAAISTSGENLSFTDFR